MTIKVLHVSTYDANGGAGRAAYSLHKALRQHGVQSRMIVADKGSSDPTVIQKSHARWKVTRRLDRQVWRLQSSPVKTWRSPARFGALSAQWINKTDADVVHLHWITDGFLSIEEIGKIEKPIVWSMYDLWPIAGTEHYGVGSGSERWKDGYTSSNRPQGDSRFDIDRWTYGRKVKSWPTSGRMTPHLLPASTWLENSVRASALARHWPSTRIPHVLDNEVFYPSDSVEARRELGLPTDCPIVFFLSSAGIEDRRKGFDVLERALDIIHPEHPGLQVLIAGPRHPRKETAGGVPIIWAGPVESDQVLRLLYCASTLVVVPSREDNMPLTAMEARSCGRPVVGSDVGGIPDIIQGPEDGELVTSEDPPALAASLTKNLHDPSMATPKLATNLPWDALNVIPRVLEVYLTIGAGGTYEY